MKNHTLTHFDNNSILGHEDLQTAELTHRGFFKSILNTGAHLILKCIDMIEDLYCEDEEDVEL